MASHRKHTTWRGTWRVVILRKGKETQVQFKSVVGLTIKFISQQTEGFKTHTKEIWMFCLHETIKYIKEITQDDNKKLFSNFLCLFD